MHNVCCFAAGAVGFNFKNMQNNTQLIPIIKQGYEQQLVDAGLLHKFLESQTRFNDWIVRKIEDYGFIEGRDFYSNLSKSTGGRKAIEYAVTLDMAKELAMLERNEKGKQARQYFIASEKELRRLQAALLQVYDEIKPLLQNCRSRMEDGINWYAVNQLRRMSNKGYVKSDRMRFFAEAGFVKQFIDGNLPRWYVKEEEVPRILNVIPGHHLSVAIVNLLKKGGTA